MNIYALLGYLAISIWQPIQIVKIILTKEVASISPLAIGVLALGLILIQVGLYQDKAKMVYQIGNAAAAISSIVLITLYILYS